MVYEQGQSELFIIGNATTYYCFEYLVNNEKIWVVNIVKYEIYEKLEKIAEPLLIIFGVYLFIQIVRKILGGSWSMEDVILALLLFIIGTLFTLNIKLTELKTDHRHLKNQFKSLAHDFKGHVKHKK